MRIYHWINAVALTVLILTGYLIGSPNRTFYAAKRTSSTGLAGCGSFTFCAYHLRVQLRLRGLLGICGEQVCEVDEVLPVEEGQRQEIVDVLKTDIFQTKVHGAITTGHNSLAAFIYFFTFLAFWRRRSRASRFIRA